MEITDFKLNDEQQKAVEILDGPVLVIAGAGSGKTRVLTARICNLIKNGVSPYNILAITFTNKAAGEMKERISLIGDYNIWASTFHSMCAKILRMDIDKIGYSKDFTIYTEIETARTISRILKAETIDEDEDKEEKKNILWCISDAKNKFLDPDEYYKLIKDVYTNSRHICKVYKEYEEELKRSNALDFDDLICKTIKLFKECPTVLDKYASRFKYIHVDEFQDTNDVQYQLVKLLSSKYKNLFVVGDEDQSIYGWRGSNIRNILDFPKDFPGTEVVKLEKNYRSTKGILTAANNVIANNRDRNIKNLWTDKEDVSNIEIYEARDDREESAKIVRAIDILHKIGEPYNEMAILVRNNSLSRQFEEELNIYNIPYVIIGGMKFYERKEIKDFLAYVRLAVNPSDNDSFLRATAFPSRKIGDKSREEISLLSKELGMSIFNLLTSYDFSKDEEHKSLIKKFTPIIEIIKDLIDKLNTMKISSYLKYVLKRSGIEDALLVDRKKDLENRYDNVCELITAAENYQKENKDSLVFDFLESTALIADTDDLSSDDKVTIATVHAVKGLEYNNVFIAACEDEIFPSYFSKIENNIEEERRLMYVAITRAKTRLMVTYTRQRFRFGLVRPSLKSMFIDEMGVRYNRPRSQSQSYNQTPIAKPEYTSDFQKGIDAMIKQGLAQKNLNENVQKARNEMSKFKVGSLVEHKKFGLGKVLNVENTENDVKLSIQFPQLGIKTFALSIAINLIKLVEGPDDF